MAQVRRAIRLSDDRPVSLPKMLLEKGQARRLEAERDAESSDQPNLAERLGAAGVEGGIDTLGLPVDVINGAADLVDLPKDYRLMGDSDDLRQLAHRHGIGQVSEAYAPQSGVEAFGQGVARFLGGAVVPLGGGVAGSAVRKGIKLLGKEDAVAKFVAQGFSPTQAKYLADPYKGQGHHFLQREIGTKLGIPDWFMDSRFNVLKPKDMSRGDFYERHFMVDPDYFHSNLPRKVGGGGWTGRRLGFEKYGLPGRLWYGSPTELKLAAGAAAGGSTATIRAQFDNQRK